MTRSVLAVALAAAACGSADADPDTVQVLAAASLTGVFVELGEAFTADRPDVELAFDFGPSSGLAARIREGAPADVFASADDASMADVSGDAEPFATNELVLAVPAGNPGGVDGLDDLADGDLLVGLCAEEAPCGRLAATLLERERVTPAVDTFEPDVRALLTKLEAGELDAGLVYRTDVTDDVEAIDVPSVLTTYPIAALSDEQAAGDFVAFVLSAEGLAILARAGFLPPPPR